MCYRQKVDKASRLSSVGKQPLKKTRILEIDVVQSIKSLRITAVVDNYWSLKLNVSLVLIENIKELVTGLACETIFYQVTYLRSMF